jgi:YLATT-like protein/MarR family protein
VHRIAGNSAARPVFNSCEKRKPVRRNYWQAEVAFTRIRGRRRGISAIGAAARGLVRHRDSLIWTRWDNTMAGLIAGAIFLIFLCGAIGGYAGFLMNPPDAAQLGQRTQPWWVWRSIVLGIVAALLVPLFLEFAGALVNSQEDFMVQVLNATKEKGIELWFVLAGLCLVVATSAQRFISTISDAVLQRLQQQINVVNQKAEEAKVEAKVAKKEAVEAQVIAEEVENDQVALAKPLVVAEGPAGVAAAAARAKPSDRELQVLRGMARTGIRRPSPDEIARATELPVEEVRKALHDLEEKGLVERREDAETGRERWRVRTQGKLLL